MIKKMIEETDSEKLVMASTGGKILRGSLRKTPSTRESSQQLSKAQGYPTKNEQKSVSVEKRKEKEGKTKKNTWVRDFEHLLHDDSGFCCCCCSCSCDASFSSGSESFSCRYSGSWNGSWNRMRDQI